MSRFFSMQPRDGCLVFLLRHGCIEDDGVKRYIGQADRPLNRRGREQAERWRMELTGIPFRRILASDLSRSRDTAEMIASSGTTVVESIPDLGEINLGEWDGRSMAEIRRRFPMEFEQRGRRLATFRPPGGESFEDLSRRVVPVFKRIVKETEGPVLIVGHAGVNRVILSRVLGLPLDNLFRINQDYAALNLIERHHLGVCVLALNWSSLDSDQNVPVGA